MKSKKIAILIITLLAIAGIVTGISVLVRDKEPPNNIEDNGDSNIPSITPPDINIPDINDPDIGEEPGNESNDPNTETDTIISPDDTDKESTTKAPTIESEKTQTSSKPITNIPNTTDKVEPSVKDETATQSGPSSGEDRNDAIIKDKEDNSPEEEHPVIVGEEIVDVSKEEKGDIIIGEDIVDVIAKEEVTFIPPKAYIQNPFESDSITEIDDTPVDEYIEEGGDRPGEGIHF